MLRTVLGTAATNENNGKLLELADRDGDTPHFQHNGGSQLAVDDDDEPSAANIDSVITQVVVRQESTSNQAPVQQGAAPGTDSQEIRNTWKDKLRSILCCLAPPTNDQYVRQDEGPVVIRPPAPRPPPCTEPVLGAACGKQQTSKRLAIVLSSCESSLACEGLCIAVQLHTRRCFPKCRPNL